MPYVMLLFILLQGEPGLHGMKGMRGELGHKGDRGPLGLPVSSTIKYRPFYRNPLMSLTNLSNVLAVPKCEHLSVCLCTCVCLLHFLFSHLHSPGLTYFAKLPVTHSVIELL